MSQIFLMMRVLFLFGVFALPPKYQRSLKLEGEAAEKTVDSHQDDTEDEQCGDHGNDMNYVVEPDLRGLHSKCNSEP